MEVYLHSLDKNNFFYDYITTMAYAQFGIQELIARAFTLQKIKEFPDPVERSKDLDNYNLAPDSKAQIVNVKTLTPTIFVPGFETMSKQKLYRMDPNHSALHFMGDTNGKSDVNLRITRMTIISAYEKVVNRINQGSSETMEFFRHIRNAAAHNGKFHFTSKAVDGGTGKLKKKAQWSHFRITTQLQDLPLFSERKDDPNKFWELGDLIDFLLEFETHHPEIKKH